MFRRSAALSGRMVVASVDPGLRTLGYYLWLRWSRGHDVVVNISPGALDDRSSGEG
jgi:hypothetical protein